MSTRTGCPDCEPARCGGCGRFISAAQAHDFGSCDECLDNALPDSNEGLPTDGWARVLRTSTHLEAA